MIASQTPFRQQDLIDVLSANGDDIRLIGRDLNGFDTRMFIAMHRPGEYVAQGREFHLLELCLSGEQSGVNRYEDLCTPASCTYRPGTLFYQPTDMPGNLRMDGTCTNLSVMISRDAMERAKRKVFKGDPDCVDLLAYNEVYLPEVKERLHALYVEHLRPTAASRLGHDLLVQELCTALLQACPSGEKRQNSKDRVLTRRELTRSIDVLEHEVACGRGLDYVAEQVGLSTFHFARAFKLTTGQSPHQYLIERRLAHVKQALICSERPLIDIALSCGFSSQAHMTTAFRRHTSITPMKFRKLLKSA